MRTIDQIVNQQVLRWNEAKRLSDRPPESTRQPQVQRPVICVSREFGSRGAEVGRLVAAELGFSFYSQELVQKIADEAHVRQELVASLDERAQDRISEWVATMIDGGSFVASTYLHNLSRVLLTLGRHGNSVIVGRGGHLILDPTHTLRVRTYAPLEARVQRIAARDHVSESAALSTLKRVDAERAEFYRTHFKVDVGDLHHFDLLLNTATLSLEYCTGLVVSAYRERFATR